MALTRVIIGVDVGGTNTDAVVMEMRSGQLHLLTKVKTATTADVTSGVNLAIRQVLFKAKAQCERIAIQQVNIGTTHFINAVVEGKHLENVAVIRLCGTVSHQLPPYSDFGEHLLPAVRGSVYMVNGGYQFNGSDITEVNEDEIKECIKSLKFKGEKNVVVSGIFSPVRSDQEEMVAEIIKKEFPEASVTASHDIGRIGLLERENAAVLNECIKPLCRKTITGFRLALNDLGMKCPLFLTQNDGTILSEERALRFPVFCFASGTTNSMRGAAFLSGVKEAMVVDVGGTSTDVGILLKGFPREASTEVKIGGIRTNFRMPDVISIGLGGGSYVQTGVKEGEEFVIVGPQSAGYRIEQEAFVFAETSSENCSVTATDIAVAAGLTEVGDKQNVDGFSKAFVRKAVEKINDLVSTCIDKLRLNNRDLPLILVGGGSIIVGKQTKFGGISKIIVPDNFDVANAVGAAMSQVSASVDKVVDYDQFVDRQVVYDNEHEPTEETRKRLFQSAREKAIQEIKQKLKRDAIANGALPSSLAVVEMEDVALTYIPGNASRIKIKIVGELDISDNLDELVITDTPMKTLVDKTSEQQSEKQKYSTSGVELSEVEHCIAIEEPYIDEESGEWILSEYDVACLEIGAGIMGCGGGLNPHIGKLIALQALRNGKKIRVVSPKRFLKTIDADKDLIVPLILMGAPLIYYEKLISGNETSGALQCLQDLYDVGSYNTSTGALENPCQTHVKGNQDISYIDDYTYSNGNSRNTTVGGKRIVAIMTVEIGGMNCLDSLVAGAELGLPVLDCDGMGRAFPEIQMFTPFIYGCKPYPATLADDKGRRAVVLNVDSSKRLENHFRNVCVEMGCSGGVVMSHLKKDEVEKYAVKHTISHAWRIGDTVLRARAAHVSPIQAVLQAENGKFLLYGFNRGKIVIDGLDSYECHSFSIEFQNEFLIAREHSHDDTKVLACVPDLITMMDADTAQPIPTEEVRFGMRVAVIAMRVDPLMSSEEALKVVGPQAFGLSDDVKYVPLGDFQDKGSVTPS
ncbi:uncharacterized protein LOC128244331 [Mya arenaria]|uniref:uncharacterized protein LOC128244331 n=1 Tax=Mya arenaria TaxID=6604 RepID=UPI0022E6F4BC|nr:uncharacterized protein LOC128244331 [Mya arenaria]